MKFILKIFCLSIALFFYGNKLAAQDYDLVTIIGVVSGNETNNALFKVYSKTLPELEYIRAQRVNGPQNGIFTQSDDNIRYTAISKDEGIPKNLSQIRFTFLKADKITPIKPANFRFGINDIDGPNNEALATTCDENLRFLGTADPTHLIVVNNPPTIIAVGAVEESEGPTSRVMFEFDNVSVIDLDNYANHGYLKDFDMNDDYPITNPILVKCKDFVRNIYKYDTLPPNREPSEFKKERNLLMVNTHPIYFDNDKFEIKEDAEVALNKVLDLLNKYPKLIIEIGSHTDSRASDAYNLELSDKRAKASIAWFVNKGIDPSRVFGKGYGETQLVNKCSNGVECTEDEHKLNRRTEFVIVNPEVILH